MANCKKKNTLFFNRIGYSTIQSILVCIFCLAIFASPTYANPQGGAVAAGQVTISAPDANTVRINQGSQKGIINWQSYNVAPNEKVQYQQPNSSSITLNRINPNNGVSKIFGSITANGHVWLVNPAGIWFGPSAYVNVAGLVASTANISDQDFLSGNYHFVQDPNWNGSIINEGIIQTAKAGLVALIGSGVVNNGKIEANLGTVVLASGSEYTIQFSGNDMIGFTVDRELVKPGVDQHGNELKDAVRNSGVIVAEGGKIQMTARTAGEILDHSINMTGVAEAKSVGVKNGEIILSGQGAQVEVSGKLIASGKKAGETGGKIQVLGNQVAITGHAKINASGNAGGGEILIGGDYQGKNPSVLNAKQTFVGVNTKIYANALSQGNGGKVIIWGDDTTQFYGNIFARGGAKGGNGGFVETSGKNYLEALGMVDASSPQGNAGSWLLDPANVTISAAVTLNGLFDGLTPLNTFTTTANNAIANVATIIASLNLGTSVTILTTPGGTQGGTITVSAPITKILSLTTPTLTLNAASTITVNSAISSTVGGLNVSFIGDSLALNAAVSTNGGNVTSTIQNATTLASTIDAGSGTVSLSGNQDAAGANAFSMNAGSSITTTNTGASAVSITNNTAAGGTGSINLRNITVGNGGTISVNAQGGSITQTAATLLDTNTGSVSLTTKQTAGLAIGTAGANILAKANSITATTGSGGIFVNNSGTGALSLGTINTTGGFTLTSTGSTGITQSAAATVTGAATITAGAGQNITLSNASNDFGTVAITSGNNVTVNDINALILGTSTISGTDSVTAGGAISQSGVLTVSGTPTFTVTAANSDILLSTQANAFTTTPVFTNNGSVRDLGLRNTLASAVVPTLPTGMRNLTLTFNAAAITLPGTTLTGTLTATAAGALTQSGAILGTTLTGKTLDNAGSAITLNNASNDFATINLQSRNAADTADAAGAINYQDATGFDVSGLRTTVNANLTSNGAMTDSGALVIGGTTTLASGAANSITLNTATNDFNTVSITNGNNITLVDANALDMGASTISGTLGLTTSGAITQSGALTVGGTATLAAGAANNITLDSFAGNNFNTVAVTTGNNVKLLDTNAIVLGTSTISGNYNVTAGGSITESGVLTVTGTPTFTLNAPTTDISLASQANNFATTPVITNNGNVRDLLLRNTNASAVVPTLPTGLRALTLTFNNATSMVLPGVTLTGSLSATANGPITQSGALIVNGAGTSATFVAGAANNITLTNASNDFATAAITSGNNVALTDINSLILGTDTVSGTFNVNTSGALTQSGTQTITGLTTLDVGSANNITLNTAANNFSTIKVLSGNNVNLRDTNALVLDTLNANGTLTVQTNGALTQTGVISATGATTLIAGAANNITLNNASNTFSNVAVTSGNNVSLADSTALALGTSTVSGTLDVSAGGAISQTGVLTVTGTPTFTVTAANSDINLSTQANVFTTTPVFTNNGNIRDLLLRNTLASAVVPTLPTGMRNLTLTFNAAGMSFPSLTLTGNLTATSSGAMTQTGALVVPGTVTLAAGAANNITLANAGNDFGTVAITTGNNVSLNDINALILGASTVNGTFGVTAGGDLTQSGTLAITGATTLNVGASNNITLATAANNFSSVGITNALNATLRDTNAIVLAASTLAGTLNVTAGNVVTQSGALTGNSLIIKTLNNVGANANITLNTSSNDFNSISLQARNAADTAFIGGVINYLDSTGFDIATAGTASTINLTAGGAITDSGAIAGTTLTTSSVGGTVLDFGDTITGFNATNTSSGNIQLVNTGALSVTGVSQSGGGDFILNNTGTSTITGTINTAAGNTNITSTGAVSDSVAGAINTSNLTVKTLANAGAAITLDNSNVHNASVVNLQSRNAADTANAAGAITFRNTGGFDVAAANTTSTVSLTGGGALTQSGSMTGTTLTAKTLNNAGAAITFNNAGNAFTSVNLQSRNAADTANTAGAIAFTNAGGFDVAAVGTTNVINLIAGGAITDSGAIAGTTLTTNSVGGTTLNFGDTITGFNATNTSSGNIQLVNTGALSVTGVSQSGGGDFILNNTGTSTITGTINAAAGNTNITSTGAVSDSVAGAINTANLTVKTLANAGAAITLDNVNLHNASVVNLQSRNAADTANAAGAITFRNTGGFDVAAANTTSTVTLTGGGAMTQSGSMTGTTLTAKTLNNAGAGINFNNAANAFTTLDLRSRNAADTADAAGNLAFADANGIDISVLHTTADANINAGGAITDSGVSVIGGTLSTTSVGGTTLNSANQINQMNLTNSGSGAISVSGNTLALTITGLSQNGGGAVTLNNTNDLTVAAGAAFNTNGSVLGITTSDFTVGDGTSVNTNDGAFTLNIADLLLNSTGALNSGAGDLSITQTTANGSIGLGNTAGTLSISGSELQRITANNFNLIAPSNGQIIVDGITGTNSNNIAGTVTLNATAGTTASISFQSGSSTFKNLTANADNGINISTGLTTTVGNLALNGDFDGSGAGGNNAVNLNGATLNSAGTLTLAAANGGIVLGGNSSLTSAGAMTISDDVNGGFNLTVNSGSAATNFNGRVGFTTPIGTGLGAALTLNSTGTTTFSNIVNANSGISAAGPVNFNNDVTLTNGNTGSTFSGLVTFNGGTGFSGFDSLAFNGGVTVANGPFSINSNNSAMSLASLILQANTTLVSGSGALTINGAVSGASNALSVQDNTASSTGTVTFNGNVVLQALNTFGNAANYLIRFNGASNTFSNPISFDNAGVIFGLATPVAMSGSNNITFGSNSSSSQVTLNVPVTITAGNGITFNSTVNGAQNLTLNAGGNITLNAEFGDITRLGLLTIQNANNFTSNATIRVSSLQSGVSGITNFSNIGLNALGSAQIASNRLMGNIDVQGLTINLNTGNFTGLVNGSGGDAAIKQFVVLNTLEPNTIFFNGIDIYTVFNPGPVPAPTPIPPIPPIPPVPGSNSALAGIVSPTNYTSSNQSLTGLTNTISAQLLQNQNKNVPSVKNVKIISSSCVEVGPHISICSMW